MLIKDPRFVVTPDKVLERKNITIKGNRIKRIGGSDKSGKVIDASDYAVLPGLVNMHTHSSMNLLRGVSDDKELQSWLQEDIWPLEDDFGEEEYYWGSMFAFLEGLKSGTTCFNDIYFRMDKIAEVAEKIGMRGYLGETMIDLGKEEERKKDVKKTKRIVKTLRNDFSDLITPTVTPHSLETCSEELLLEAKEIADENDLLLHMHLAETHKEVEKSLKEYGKRPVEHLDDLGLIDERFIGAHGVHLINRDMITLAEKNATVVHNPCSNMKLASGVAPVAELLRKNVNVCLGTDSVASNNNLDLFEEMKFASLLQKVNSADPTVLPVDEVLKLSLSNPSKALGRDVGKIREGALADLVLVDLDSAEMRPIHDLRSNLVYSGAPVDTVIVNGGVVLSEGEPTQVNEQEVYRKVEELAQNLTS